MNYSKVNRLIFEALETIDGIKTSRVSMYSTSNIYDYPPFMRFKFINIPEGDIIYTELKNAIESFKGMMEWKLLQKSAGGNYLIMPSFFDNMNKATKFYDKNFYLGIIGDDEYKRKIDDTINDIPQLATQIINFKQYC